MPRTAEKHKPVGALGQRTPGQARAKETVKAILTAARLLLEEDRPFSTSLIAERAGVSVGSLYQYFADKEAIAAQLYASYLDEFYEHLHALAGSTAELSPSELTAAIVRDVFHLQQTKVSFRRKLKAVLGPAVLEAILSASFTPKLESLLQAVAQRLAPTRTPEEQATLCFLLSTLLPHLVHETFAQRPGLFFEQAYEEQVQRLVHALL